jgi:hypothetical protein
MRGLVRKTILATAIAGSSIFLAVGAQAHDGGYWRGEQWRGEHRQYAEVREHWRHVEPPRRFFYQRPPVIMAHRFPSWWHR